MFRNMRRANQLLSEAETERILKEGSTGVLAVSGDDGYPYTVPLNYVYIDGKIYFHCAREGHKIDALKRNDKVSFCIISDDKVVPELFATAFRSVIVFGRARILDADEEIIKAVWAIADKYSPEYHEKAKEEISSGLEAMYIVEITVEHMTGKQAKKSVMG